MQKVLGLTLIAGLLILSSCGHHNSQSALTLKFKPMFGANNVVLNNTYSAPDGKNYNFTTLKFYLSHIKLVHSDGSSVEVKSLAYISLDDAADMSISLSDVEGSYTGIQFNIGVDSTQDNAPVNMTDSANPQFVNNNMYWDPSRQYVFVIMEGHADTLSSPQNPIEYHIGTAPYYTTVQLSKSFSVSSSGQTTLNLTADLQKIFWGSTGTPINVLTDPYTETTGGTYYSTLAHTYMTDFSQTFSLQ